MSDVKRPADSESVKAYVRIRPAPPESREECVLAKMNDNRIVNTDTGEGYEYGTTLFYPERVFGPENTNEEVYQGIVEKHWGCLTKGINMCVFTYGQTNSGKTHTMKGQSGEPGLVPKTLEGLFTKLGTQMKCAFEFSMSYFEVYNEGIFDLLDPSLSNTQLEVRQNKEKGIFIQNLTTVHVENLAQAKELYEKGEQKRRYAVTNMNHNSSRSHVVLQLNIKSRFLTLPVRTNNSILMMADLAGSECIEKSKTTGLGQREGSLINKSLLSLSNIITKLNNNDGFVSFRESKLTRILQPVLTENSRVSVICTVSPSREHLPESLSTLRFGKCAGGIRMKQKLPIPEKKTPGSITCISSEELTELQGEVKMLRQIIFDLEDKLTNTEHSLAVEQDNNQILKRSKEFLEDTVEEMKKENDKLCGEVKRLEALFVEQEASIELRALSQFKSKLIEYKGSYETEILRLKADLLEQIENNTGAFNDTKLKNKFKDLQEKLAESNKDNRMKHEIISYLRDDNRKLRTELAQTNESSQFRARKAPKYPQSPLPLRSPRSPATTSNRLISIPKFFFGESLQSQPSAPTQIDPPLFKSALGNPFQSSHLPSTDNSIPSSQSIPSTHNYSK
jgi:centromeric protein E